MNVTAKVKVVQMETLGLGTEHEQVQIHFGADYDKPENKAWSVATPTIGVNMTVKPEVAKNFVEGESFTLTFSKEQEGPDTSSEVVGEEDS